MTVQKNTEHRRGGKYPTKRRVNLAKREHNSRNVVTLAVGIVLIGALSLGVAKFGVIDQLARQSQAAQTYNKVHSQYLQMMEQLQQYGQVEQEYRTYSREWMTSGKNEGFVSVDRMQVLDLLETQLMPCGSIKSLVVQDETLVVTMSGMNLEQISRMFEQLKQQPIVAGAALNIAATDESAPEDKLDFSITIILQAEEKK